LLSLTRRIKMPTSHHVPLLGQGGHTFCNSSFGNEPRGFPGAISVLGGALSARAEAKNNWNMARENAIRTGNHMDLPNGKHHINGYEVTVTKNNIVYKDPNTGERHGIVKETGERYTYSGL
jgi:hypothetical protein